MRISVTGVSHHETPVELRELFAFSGERLVEALRRIPPDLGAVILCLNSAVYVQKGGPNEQRGEVDQKQLERIDQMLEAVPAEFCGNLRQKQEQE